MAQGILDSHLYQDTRLCHVVLKNDQRRDVSIEPGRTLYLHVLQGDLAVYNECLHAGEGAM